MPFHPSPLCPQCGSATRVLETRPPFRLRYCTRCPQTFKTEEIRILDRLSAKTLSRRAKPEQLNRPTK